MLFSFSMAKMAQCVAYDCIKSGRSFKSGVSNMVPMSTTFLLKTMWVITNPIALWKHFFVFNLAISAERPERELAYHYSGTHTTLLKTPDYNISSLVVPRALLTVKQHLPVTLTVKQTHDYDFVLHPWASPETFLLAVSGGCRRSGSEY